MHIKLWSRLLSFLAASTCASVALANAAPLPKPPAPKPVDSVMKVEVKAGVTEAQLILPKKLAPGQAGAKAEADGISPGRTVVAGIAMSAALMMGGLFLVRRRSAGRGATLAVAIVGAAGLLTAGVALADIPGPGPRVRPRPPEPPAPPVFLPDGLVPLKVEWTDEGDTTRLIISPEMVARWVNPTPNHPPAQPNDPPKTGAAPVTPPPPPG